MTDAAAIDEPDTDERGQALLHLAFACAEAGVPMPDGEDLESAIDEIVMAEEGPDDDMGDDPEDAE